MKSRIENPAQRGPNKPKAYLIYMFFDDQFKFYPGASGILQVQYPNVLGTLGILNVKMPANGFFYIYTNNESTKQINFNDLIINHFAGVLIEENHFYPYGLTMEGITPTASANGSINKYKFSDKEFQLDLSLNQYDLGARFYDPVTGRFNVIDPLADLASDYTPFRYAFDNPLSFIDPTGLSEECYTFGSDKEREADPDETLEKEEVHSDTQVEIQAGIENRKVIDANNDGEDNEEKKISRSTRFYTARNK